VAAICIITPEGLKCSASAIKQHRPAGTDCRAWKVPGHLGPEAAKQHRGIAAAKHAVRGAVLEKVGHGKKAAQMAGVIARVAELMIAAGVDGSTPFTIVKAK